MYLAKQINMFRFKQFTIEQEHCAMKVGTDGTLLGAWADISHSERILDIGCGSGLIAIMAAQRSNADVIGIEIDCDAAHQAQKNVMQCAWSDRIEIINCDIQKYHSDRLFDAIVSNPPFFKNSLKCPDNSRTTARHDDTLPCHTLMQCAKNLLADRGTLSVVIPSEMLGSWCDEALFKGLSARRITHVRTLPHKPSKRVLIEFVKGAHAKPVITEFILENTPGNYSQEAKELLRDFYIKIE